MEENLASKTRAYRKALQQALFELNNANYLLRSLCLVAPLCTLLTRETEQRYRLQVETATRRLLAWWSSLAEQLRGDTTPPKDRLKAFGQYWEEGMRLLTTLTIPDGDLRKSLQAQIRELIIPPLRSFYTQHAISLQSTMTKYNIPDLEAVERQIDRLFAA